MSDRVAAQSPLKGASFRGFATVREIGPFGMITLRAKAGTPGLEAAIKAANGTDLPGPRHLARAGDAVTAWMSPDEFLLVVPHVRLAEAMAALSQGLSGQHHLVADVSDARAVFAIEGPEADHVLRKLSPADIDAMAPNEIRRSRLAQVSAAFWAEGSGYHLVCFRSVAGYVMDLLSNAAGEGGQL